jgi:hypothetical protein
LRVNNAIEEAGDGALVVAGGARLEFKGPTLLFVTHLLA